MATNPYIVRMAHPEDCVFVHGAGTAQEVRDVTVPVDFSLKNEITWMIFHELPENKENVPCHMHTEGTETFIPVSGRIEVVCNGCLTVMEPGDIMHIEPYMSHSFRAVEKDSSMMCLFQGFNMIKLVENVFAAEANEPGVRQTPHFQAMYAEKAHKIDRSVPDPLKVPKGQIPNLVQEGRGKVEYTFPGLRLLLKTGKWQTCGQREMWEADMSKGAVLTWGERRIDYRLFHLRKGTVRLTVNGEEFTVGEEAIIHLPPFVTFSFEALEDAVLYDLDCPDSLAAFMEDLGDLQKKRWESDPGLLAKLKDNCNITVTGYEYKE